jgi:hypothetical protein
MRGCEARRNPYLSVNRRKSPLQQTEGQVEPSASLGKEGLCPYLQLISGSPGHIQPLVGLN